MTAPGTGHGAVLGDAVQVQRDVEEGDFARGAVRIPGLVLHVRAHDLGGGAAGNDSLEFAAFTGAAADVVQQFAEGHGTGNDFIIAGAPHVAGDADDARAGGAFGAFLSVGFAAMAMTCFT